VHDSRQEQPATAGDLRHDRHDPEYLFGYLPVGSEIVLAAKPVVVDPGRVRHAGIKGGTTHTVIVLGGTGLVIVSGDTACAG
jgi:hypothetical protein